MEDELADALRVLGSRNLPIFVGTIKKVDKAKGFCSVLYDAYEDENLVLDNVRLSAIIDGKQSKIYLFPKVGSSVLVGSINEDITQLYIEQYSELEEIQLLNGQFGGLVKVEELTKKINRLENKLNSLITKYNGHTHITTATISATPVVGVITPPVTTEIPITPITNRKDIENEKVKHGE